MDTRKPIQKQILVSSLNETGQRTIRSFTIDGTLSTAGASSICYAAHDMGSGRGVLKEFYPLNIPTLCRDKLDQLHASPVSEKEAELFEQGLQEYLRSYQFMLDLKQDSAAAAQGLASFIPPYELYRGCNEHAEHVGTAYVWLPVPEYVTFDRICSEIHQKPETGPQRNLVLLLKSVYELADCVLELHKRGLLHRDIKPQNFGFMTRNSQLLEQTLSFFDLDSLCDLADAEDAIYSEGYTDPEVMDADHIPGIRDDFYSIGATLFHAVVISGEPDQPQTYHPSFYPRLPEMIAASPLLKLCRRHTHPKFQHQLTEILQRCLCHSSDKGVRRYASCVELKKDLHRLLAYVMPVKPQRNGTWVWKEAEKQLDKQQDEKARLALQYHLYQHPLHKASNETDINVLIMGFGYYGQQFADACLQTGQLLDRQLNITVISEDALDKKVYLDARPELPAFFNVDGSLDNDPDSYGNITFITRRLTFPDSRNEDMLDEDRWLELYLEENTLHKPHCVFIALGNDDLNLAAARLNRYLIEGRNPSIHFAWEGKRLSEEKTGDLLPIYVSENVRREKGYAELERMALNTHLVWEKNMNVDFQEVKKQFSDPYYHKACIDNVLSLKGKLYGFNIDLDQMSAAKAADTYASKVKDADVRQKTIWLEHRRWVTAMICDGWRALTNLEECIALQDHRDKQGKRHACIRRSRSDQNLRKLYYEKDQYENDQCLKDLWDGTTQDKAQYKQLDPLDLMSLELHRTYLKEAEKQKLTSWDKVGSPALRSIDGLVAQHARLSAAWREYRACVRDIWHGEVDRIYHHDALRSSFISLMEEAQKNSPDADLQKPVEAELKKLDIVLSVLIKSAAYRDFKQEDVKIVDQIPFILTYSSSTCMVIPYMQGDNSSLFRNVAAPLVVNPTEIVYLCYLENSTELHRTIRSLSYVFSFLKRKNIRAAIEFRIAYVRGSITKAPDDIIQKFQDASGNSLEEVKLHAVDGPDEAIACFRQYLRGKKNRSGICTLEQNDSKLSWLLQGAGVYKSIANYRFSISNMTFQKDSGCTMYSYITKKPSLSVADIAAMKKSASLSQAQPEYYDLYADLWNKSRKDGGSTWKTLCSALKAYAEQNDLIAAFQLRHAASQKAAEKTYQYLIPAECVAAVTKILHELSQHQLIVSSSITPADTENYRVEIVDALDHQHQFSTLFRDRSKLYLEKDIQISIDKYSLKVLYNNLTVNEISLVFPADSSSTGAVASLMQFLVSKGCLLCCTSQSGKYSFAYASQAIKELLTMEGRILEVYVYHKLKGSVFDDVVSSYEIGWEDTEVKNELDVIATKGFSSLFIECKARGDLNQDFYFKLISLTEQFGINAKAVLIADTQEYGNRAILNRMQRNRGKMLDIVTIWKEHEIRAIDQTLLKVLNGTYRPSDD